MVPENLKSLGAVGLVLGLLDISLGSLLLQVGTFFKKEIPVIFIAGGWTILTGFSLLCIGKKPSYDCVKANVLCHLVTLVFSAVAFGFLVKHVPYQQQRYCTDSCPSVHHDTMVLVGGILAVLITSLLVQLLISMVVTLTGVCVLCDSPQPEESEGIGSATSDPLCLPPQSQDAPEVDAMKTDS